MRDLEVIDEQTHHSLADESIDRFKSIIPPIINYINREVFEFKGNKYLVRPSLQELLVEAKIRNVRVFRGILREFHLQGVETLDDLYDFSKSKILHLDSFSQQNANKLIKHLIRIKHKGPLLLGGDKLELLENEYFYLEFVKDIDMILFKHMNGKQGLRSKSLIEICGSDGVGKTQWCMTATCSMLQVGKRVVYVDSDDAFNYPRIKQIAIQNKLSQRSIKDNVMLSRIDSFDELDLLLQELSHSLSENNVGMIVIDSIMQLLQNTYPVTTNNSWDNIAIRQLHLRRTMRRLRSMARNQNLIVIYTNYTREGRYKVPLNITDEFPDDDADDLKYLTKLLKRLAYIQLPMGGPTLAHSSDLRIYLGPDGDNQSRLLALIENCSYLPKVSLNYIITGEGIKSFNSSTIELQKDHVDDLNELLG
ncbi:MAG: DNA repair and recombination protein RadA [Candidatus Heimdallarchaeota archaeon LC_2]|nr:MAG: DNA repair and recombination protein RadA [Candidatus Heimdallarchaeota archaeon LC_2]